MRNAFVRSLLGIIAAACFAAAVVALASSGLDVADVAWILGPVALLATVYVLVRLDSAYQRGDVRPKSRRLRWLFTDSTR